MLTELRAAGCPLPQEAFAWVQRLGTGKRGRSKKHDPGHDELVFLFVEAIRARMGFTGRMGVTEAQDCYAHYSKLNFNVVEKAYQRARKFVAPLPATDIEFLNGLLPAPRFMSFLTKIKRSEKLPPTAKIERK